MTRTKRRKTSRPALAGLAPPLPLSHHQPRASLPHRALPRHASAFILPRLRGAYARAELVAFTALEARVAPRVLTRRRRGRCTCVARASRLCLSRARPRICGASQSLSSSSRAKRRTRQDRTRQRFSEHFLDLALLFISQIRDTDDDDDDDNNHFIRDACLSSFLLYPALFHSFIIELNLYHFILHFTRLHSSIIS